ncbi:hypothetical protein LR48_Vigan02g190000 [Vigna angularis]|uniref:Uncharacterized protein n=1 Tax=Phaseolus angularis TaxID=3914 RepID=A0A0L9TYY0_PHAAN|nr:hypothetical protein LR48_Vigan02g190000 [Vigna angularis]
MSPPLFPITASLPSAKKLNQEDLSHYGFSSVPIPPNPNPPSSRLRFQPSSKERIRAATSAARRQEECHHKSASPSQAWGLHGLPSPWIAVSVDDNLRIGRSTVWLILGIFGAERDFTERREEDGCHPGHSASLAINHPASLAINHPASRALNLSVIRSHVFKHSTSNVPAFGHSASLTLGLSASTARPYIYTSTQALGHSTPLMISQSDSINVRPLASVVQLSTENRAFKHLVVQTQRNLPFDFKRSTIHVHERSTGYTPSGSCSPKNTQNINRSTIHVHERSTGYTPSGKIKSNCGDPSTATLSAVLIPPNRTSMCGDA